MNRQTQQQLIERAETRVRPRIRSAYTLSIQRIRDRISRRELTAFLTAGDTGGAMQLVEAAILAEPFRPLETALHEALAAAGKLVGEEIASTVVRKRAPWGFRVFEPATVESAQSWIGGVTRYLINTARAVAVSVMLGGAAERTPAQVARDVIESIGLTERQAQGAESLRVGLERERQETIGRAAQESDRATLRQAQKRTPAQIETQVERYRRRAERLRGGMIATHQARAAAALAVQSAWAQAAADGLIDARTTVKRWHHLGDHKVRDTHRSIPLLQPDGVPLLAAFRTSAGNIVRYPGDFAAPISETVSCRCFLSYSIGR